MSQKSLAGWLKLVIIGVSVCGLAVFGAIIPLIGQNEVYQYPEFAYCYWPWLIFLWLTAIPCFLILAVSWKVAANISADRSFSRENALYLKQSTILAGGDTVFFFIGNVVYLFLGLSHPGIFVLALLATIAGVAASITFAALSHLVLKASVLQDESDSTI